MNSFIKKAISLFVELDEEKPNESQATESASTKPEMAAGKTQAAARPTANVQIKEADISKFEQHFSKLFDEANLPGPDYYEFWKMMDTLEAHIPAEGERMNAVFASLKVQGLSKEVLLQSAQQYKDIIERDRNNFEAAVTSKVKTEVEGRQSEIAQLTQEHSEKEQQIARLQNEIAQAKERIALLQQEIDAEKTKIDSAQNGYIVACNAMMSKIVTDIEAFGKL